MLKYIKKHEKIIMFIIWLLALIVAVFQLFQKSDWNNTNQITNSWSQNNILQTNSWNISQNISSWNINIQSNNWQIAIWSNNNLVQNKLPTEIEEKQTKQWEECETTLRALFRRLNRNDFESSFALFDEHLSKSKYFSIGNLKRFRTDFVTWDLEIWELNRKFIDNSVFVARCEFDFKLRYINKNDWKDKIEMWKWVVLKDKDKVDKFQIWELKCLDVKCENNPLLKL